MRLARTAPGELLIVILGLTALGIATDHSGSPGMVLGLSVLQLAGGYWLTIRLMEKGGLLPNGLDRGFGSYFGLGIVANMAVAFGLLILVIPGIILLIRWLPAYGFMFGERLGAMQALEQSWKATKPHFTALLVAALPSIGLFLVAMATSVVPEYFSGLPLIVNSTISNFVIYLNVGIWTLLGLAAYSLLSVDHAGVTEVFA